MRSGDFANIGGGMLLAVRARMRWAFLIVAMLSGCIEGPESKNWFYDISPRPCETGLPADQTFEVTATADDYAAVSRNPPRFEIATGGERIGVETTLAGVGKLSLRPLSPLPMEDFVLELLDPGALGPHALAAEMFPVTYSGRAQGDIRSYRAAQNEVFISFSKALDPASVPPAVTVMVVGLPVTVTTEYVESPDHVVHISVQQDARPVDITFAPSLRAADGTAVFPSPRTVRLDPVYEVPEANGCESSTL
jgi:hypothetical protein